MNNYVSCELLQAEQSSEWSLSSTTTSPELVAPTSPSKSIDSPVSSLSILLSTSLPSSLPFHFSSLLSHRFPLEPLACEASVVALEALAMAAVREVEGSWSVEEDFTRGSGDLEVELGAFLEVGLTVFFLNGLSASIKDIWLRHSSVTHTTVTYHYHTHPPSLLLLFMYHLPPPAVEPVLLP